MVSISVCRIFTEMWSIEVKDAMIIPGGLMCEATMTNNTGLNSIISWAVDLNDRKSPFYSEYSCRSEQWYLIFVYIKVVISTSQLLHINDIMTFLFVTSYFWSVTLGIIIKSCGLTIGAVVTLWNIHIILTNQSMLSPMTGFQGMVGFGVSYDFICRAGMVENRPWYNKSYISKSGGWSVIMTALKIH